jgi:photosystem II stability/assembly factor-like uncharacterized protein
VQGVTNFDSPVTYDIFSELGISFTNGDDMSLFNNWTERSKPRKWKQIVMTTNGEFQLAISANTETDTSSLYNGGVYASNDYGETWDVFLNFQEQDPSCIAMSATSEYITYCSNGSSTSPHKPVLYRIINQETIYTSYPTFSIAVQAISMSSSGQYQVLAEKEGYLYFSEDYGESFSPIESLLPYKGPWVTVVMNASGEYIVASQEQNEDQSNYTLYELRDNLIDDGLSSRQFVASNIAMSASGQYRVLTSRSQGFYISNDYGATYTLLTDGITNYSCVAMSATGQYIFVGFIFFFTQGLFFSPDYGISFTLSYTNTFPDLIDPFITTMKNAVAISSCGQYATFCADDVPITTSQNLFNTDIEGKDLSTTFSVFGTSLLSIGNNFMKLDHPLDFSPNSISVSSSSQYQLFIANGRQSIYTSNNYGIDVTLRSLESFVYTNASISASGQYQIVGLQSSSNSIYQSSDFGETWSQKTMTDNAVDNGIVNASFVAMSCSGRYRYVLNEGSEKQILPMMISQDYGKTFLESTLRVQGNVIGCSSSGKYVIVIENINMDPNTESRIYQSYDFGLTFQENLTLSRTLTYQCVAISATAQYQVLGCVNGAFVSNDYGQTWTLFSFGSVSISSNAISCTGQYILLGSISGSFLTSTNFGETFETVFFDHDDDIIWSSTAISSSGQYSYIVQDGVGVWRSVNSLETPSSFGKAIGIGMNLEAKNAIGIGFVRQSIPSIQAENSITISTNDKIPDDIYENRLWIDASSDSSVITRVSLSSGTYIKPLRSTNVVTGLHRMYYDNSTGEFYYQKEM